MKKKLLFLPLLMTLNACSFLDSLVTEKKEAPLAGERMTILRDSGTLATDPALAGTTVSLPVAVENDQWTQRGGTPSNFAPNLFALSSDAGELTVRSEGKAGDGKEWTLPLSASPVVAEDKVYAMDARNMISAHKRDNLAEVLWQHRMSVSENDRFEGGGMVLMDKKLIAVSAQGQVEAIDAATGETRWTRSLSLPVRSAPKTDGRYVYIRSVDNQLFALELESGSIGWKHQGMQEITGNLGAPTIAVEGNLLVVPYSSGEIYGLDAATGREIWREALISNARTGGKSRLTDISASPIIAEGRVYGGSQGGVLAAFDAKTGLRVWERDMPSVQQLWLSSPLLLVLTSDKRLSAVRGDDGRIQWVQELPGFADQDSDIYWSGSMVLGGRVAVFGNHGRILLLNANTGAIEREISWPSKIRQLPSVAGAMLFVVTDKASVVGMK
jgi:outer membrane protein assembly factor BamB